MDATVAHSQRGLAQPRRDEGRFRTTTQKAGHTQTAEQCRWMRIAGLDSHDPTGYAVRDFIHPQDARRNGVAEVVRLRSDSKMARILTNPATKILHGVAQKRLARIVRERSTIRRKSCANSSCGNLQSNRLFAHADSRRTEFIPFSDLRAKRNEFRSTHGFSRLTRPRGIWSVVVAYRR